MRIIEHIKENERIKGIYSLGAILPVLKKGL